MREGGSFEQSVEYARGKFSRYMRSRLYCLEELHISVLKLLFKVVRKSDMPVIDLCYMSSVLKRVSFTAVDGFRVA